jgi:hypothetical protein
MLLRSDLAELRTLVREEISHSMAGGGGSPRQIARLVCARAGGLIETLGQQPAETAVTDMVRKEIKKWAAVGSSAREQLSLPGFAAHILADLPASLCVPVPGGDPDDGEDRSYRPLAGKLGITVGEAEAALALLEAGIADDQRKARAIKEALDIARATGATPSTRLAAALARAADLPAAA